MGRKMCAICHNTFYDKSTLNQHVKNLHGAGRQACDETKCSRKDKVIYSMEISIVIKIFVTNLKQYLLTNSTSPFKLVVYMMKTLLSTPFPANMVKMMMAIQGEK